MKRFISPFSIILDMGTISHPCVLSIREIYRTRNEHLYTRPYVFLGLFIAMILIRASLCSEVIRQDNTPSVIRIGALASYDTFIGRAAIKAIQMALDDINKDKNLLNTSELALYLLDTNCSAFTGVAAGKPLQFFMFRCPLLSVSWPGTTSPDFLL